MNRDRVEASGIEHIDGLYSYAMILTRDELVAQDLVAETYLANSGAENRRWLELGKKAELITMLRHLWLSKVRERQIRYPLNDDGVEGEGSIATIGSTNNSSDLIANTVEIDKMRLAIENLSLELREIIFLREYEDLSYSAIARVLDCPRLEVISRLGRARGELRSIFAASLYATTSAAISG